MVTKYGMPLFLEDKTGRLSGSEFVDIHDRMRLIYQRMQRDGNSSAFGIYEPTSRGSSSTRVPAIILEFGPDHSLGNITFGSDRTEQIITYLSKVDDTAGPTLRRFFASDGREYRWAHRVTEDNEWTCTNSDGYMVACYNLKSPGEPEYMMSSGCALTVEEEFPHLACEMLATVMIMRHIVRYNLDV